MLDADPVSQPHNVTLAGFKGLFGYRTLGSTLNPLYD